MWRKVAIVSINPWSASLAYLSSHSKLLRPTAEHPQQIAGARSIEFTDRTDRFSLSASSIGPVGLLYESHATLAHDAWSVGDYKVVLHRWCVPTDRWDSPVTSHSRRHTNPSSSRHGAHCRQLMAVSAPWVRSVLWGRTPLSQENNTFCYFGRVIRRDTIMHNARPKSKDVR